MCIKYKYIWKGAKIAGHKGYFLKGAAVILN